MLNYSENEKYISYSKVSLTDIFKSNLIVITAYISIQCKTAHK